jgi:hypothetical protein
MVGRWRMLLFGLAMGAAIAWPGGVSLAWSAPVPALATDMADAPSPLEPRVIFTWNSISATATVDLNTGRRHAQLNLSGVVSLPDDERLVAVSWRPELTRVVDDAGVEYELVSGHRMGMTMLHGVHAHENQRGVSVSLPEMNPLPESVSVWGRLHVAVRKASSVRRFPLNQPTEWVDLRPNFAVRFTQLRADEQSVQIEGEVVCRDPAQVSQMIQHGQAVTTPRIGRVWLQDGAGGRQYLQGGLSAGGWQEEEVFRGRFRSGSNWSGPRTFDMLHVEVIDSVEVVEVPFDLQRAPLPRLP